MAALSKVKIAEQLMQQFDLKRRDAMQIIDLFFEEIRAALESGHHVKLSGFGNFCLRDKAERPGRNPKTGTSTPISARRVVTFRPGQKLKGKIGQYGNGPFPADSQTQQEEYFT